QLFSCNCISNAQRSHSCSARGSDSWRRVFNRQTLMRLKRGLPRFALMLIQLLETFQITIRGRFTQLNIFGANNDGKQWGQAGALKDVTNLLAVRHAYKAESEIAGGGSKESCNAVEQR